MGYPMIAFRRRRRNGSNGMQVQDRRQFRSDSQPCRPPPRLTVCESPYGFHRMHTQSTDLQRSTCRHREQEELMSTRTTVITAAIATVLAAGAVGGVALAWNPDG